MTNGQRWAITLALGFLGGVADAALERGATVADYIRHGLIGLGPGVAALKMTLEGPAKANSAISGK